MSYLNFRKNLGLMLTLKKNLPGRYVNRKRFKSSYYVTTPIFYVNSDPHLGHLYTACIADAAVRFQLLKNPKTELKFMTGTDEHGTKISESAKAKNMEMKPYCDEVSEKYKKLFDTYRISYTDFLRTTEDRHRETVKMLWELIYNNGHIYKGMHEGWYSADDETFFSELELQPEEKPGIRFTKTLNRPTHFIKELNYKFKLSHFKNDLLRWLEKDAVKPAGFKKILLNLIENEGVMKDISISRPASRVNWAIPVPNDPSQTIYVWMDALTSYLTSSGYPYSKKHWPPDLQVIGKDILRFHGIYWPAFLMAADIEPPKTILCHSHWLVNDKKISKSLGNVVDPMEEAIRYTSEGFRYFLLKQSVPHQDCRYHQCDLRGSIYSDLSNKLGNLLLRISGKINPETVFPHYSLEAHTTYCKSSSEALIRSLEELPDSVYSSYENFKFNEGISKIMTSIKLANQFVENEKPWSLKSSEDVNHRKIILHFALETLRVCGILLQPVIPQLSENLLNMISISKNERSLSSIRPFSWEKNKGSGPENLILKDQRIFPNSVL